MVESDIPNQIDTTALEGLSPTEGGVGWSDNVEFLATRYRQGGRRHLTIAVPIGSVGSVVEAPNPDEPLPGNRRVDVNRAKKFAEYLRARPRWVSPAVIGRVESEHVNEEVVIDLGNGIAIVRMRMPRWLLAKILDGQHRVLGAQIAIKKTRDRISELGTLVREARDQANPELVLTLEAELNGERRILDRLTSEAITVELALLDDGESGQMFVDINANAKGVNPDLTTVLDQSKVINRIANAVIGRSRLLIGRVEFGQATRMTPSNPNLIGAKSVADIASGVLVGKGRVGRRVESELGRDEHGSATEVIRFLDVLSTVPGLVDIAAGDIEPMDLRDNDQLGMLGSATMLRVLAMVWHEMVREPASDINRLEATEFGQALTMAAKEGWFSVPVNPGHPLWESTAFMPEAKAPMARQGTITDLTNFFVVQLGELARS
jgi:hypothetical protein